MSPAQNGGASRAGDLTPLHQFQAETLRLHARYLQTQMQYAEALLHKAQAWPAPRPTPETAGTAVERHPVRLKALSVPDEMETVFPPGHLYLVSDDGTSTAAALARSVQGLGMRVALLSFPRTAVPERAPVPEGVTHIELAGFDETHVREKLPADVAIGGLLHLHPRFDGGADGDLRFSTGEKNVLKCLFFLAKHLKEPLARAAGSGRSFFVAVSRLDGRLGLSAEADYSPLAGGLGGLVKSLNLEWEVVFCRAVDLSPLLDDATAADCIAAELRDPNLLLAETAWDPEGRFTLIAQKEVAR